ncbi:MAG: glycosyltransferase family 4 protein [Anaerolineales bacterium]
MRIGYLMQQGVDLGAPVPDGPANHVHEVISHLQGLGHEVTLLARSNGHYSLMTLEGEGGFRTTRQLSASNRSFVERAIRRLQDELHLPYLNLFDSLQFASICQQELAGCDVLLERVSWTGFGGTIAARRMGRPLILEYNGDPLHDLEAKGIAPRGVQKWLTIALTRRSLRRARYIVASGSGWQRQLIERWRVDPAKTRLVENGTALLGFLPRQELACFNVDSNQRGYTKIVYLGGFQPWQGVEKLLQAVNHAKAVVGHLEVELLGDGPEMNTCRQLANELGLESVCSFRGRMSSREYGPLLAAADVGVAPYCGWSEYSGLKIMDYKAAGLATIASGEGGQPATIHNEQTGLIVPPCDVQALSAAIVRLASDPKLRHRMGRQARLEAERLHGWDSTAKALEEILSQAMVDD